MPLYRMKIRKHDCKGFVRTVFSVSQQLDGFLPACVREKVKAAQAFHGNDFAFANGGCCFLQSVMPGCYCLALAVPQGQLRAAVRAAIRLGVKAAVEWIGVLFATYGAHGEIGHGCIGSVIGQAGDNAVAGSAIGAIGEGIKVPPVARRKDIFKAIRAGCYIGQRQRLNRPIGGLAAPNNKAAAARSLHHRARDIVNVCQGWSRTAQGLLELLKHIGFGFDLANNPLSIIEDPARKPQLCRDAVGKGTKANALNRTANFQSPAFAAMRRGCSTIPFPLQIRFRFVSPLFRYVLVRRSGLLDVLCRRMSRLPARPPRQSYQRKTR